jgi:seryl-tRNA synthetase
VWRKEVTEQLEAKRGIWNVKGTSEMGGSLAEQQRRRRYTGLEKRMESSKEIIRRRRNMEEDKGEMKSIRKTWKKMWKKEVNIGKSGKSRKSIRKWIEVEVGKIQRKQKTWRWTTKA